MDCYSARKSNAVMPSAAPCTDLETVTLCEASQREVPCHFPYMGSRKRNDIYELTYKAETDSQTYRMNYGYGVEGTVRESGMDMDTWLCLTRRTSKDLLDSKGNSAQCHVAAGMGGELGEESIPAHVQLSTCAVYLKPSQYC